MNCYMPVIYAVPFPFRVLLLTARPIYFIFMLSVCLCKSDTLSEIVGVWSVRCRFVHAS